MVLSPFFHDAIERFRLPGDPLTAIQGFTDDASAWLDLCECFYVGLVNIAGKLSDAREMNSLCVIFPLCN